MQFHIKPETLADDSKIIEERNPFIRQQINGHSQEHPREQVEVDQQTQPQGQIPLVFTPGKVINHESLSHENRPNEPEIAIALVQVRTGGF